MEITNSGSETYHYTPLKQNEIRLLKILPGSEDTTVSCHLKHYSLDDLPEYSALSYTWGTDVAKFPIRVNDQLQLINSNLNAALPQFRAKPIKFEDAVVGRFLRIASKVPTLFKDVDRRYMKEDSDLFTSEMSLQNHLEHGNLLVEALRDAYRRVSQNTRNKPRSKRFVS